MAQGAFKAVGKSKHEEALRGLVAVYFPAMAYAKLRALCALRRENWVATAALRLMPWRFV
jgi:hypothetical protein